LKDGTRSTVWTKAEAKAREVRDSWDPIKRKLKELEVERQVEIGGEVTIEADLKTGSTASPTGPQLAQSQRLTKSAYRNTVENNMRHNRSQNQK
jgi:hypothetical protein